MFLAIALLLAAHVLRYNSNQNLSQAQLADKLQELLIETNGKIYNEVSGILDTIDFNNLNEQTAKKLYHKPYSLILLENDMVGYWSGDLSLPQGMFKNYNAGNYGVKLQNGYYLMVKHKINNREALAFFKVYNSYPFTNKYLKSGFTIYKNIDLRFKLDVNKIDGASIIKSSNGKRLFYLKKIDNSGATTMSGVSSILYWLSIVLLFLFLYHLASDLAKNKKYYLGLLLLLASLFAIKLLINATGYPFNINNSALFHPKLFASKYFNSLGNLLIISLILLVASRYFYKHGRLAARLRRLRFKIGAYGILIFLNTLLAFLLLLIIQSIIIDSNIPFDISNLLELNRFSLIGLTIIIVLIISFFLFTQKIFELSREITLSKPGKTILVIAILLAGLGYVVLFEFSIYSIIVGLMVAFYLIISLWIPTRKSIWQNFPRFILWIIFFAGLTSLLIVGLNEIKDKGLRKALAYKLSVERDYKTEYSLNIVSNKIESDNFLKNYFNHGYLPINELNKRMRYLYLNGFDNYRSDIYLYGANDNPISPNYNYRKSQLDSLKSQFGVSTEYPDITYLAFGNNRNAYLLHKKLFKDKKMVGNLYMLLNTEDLQVSTTPDLLLSDQLGYSALNIQSYSYAIYKGENLIYRHGDFAYPYEFDQSLGSRRNKLEYLINFEGYKHLVHTTDSGSKIVVSSQNNGLGKSITTFSYLVCLYALAIVLIAFFEGFFKLLRGELKLTFFTHAPMRRRISLAMLGLIILSFIIIGVVTVLYYRNDNNIYHKNRLERKLNSVLTAMEFIVNERPQSFKGSNDLLNVEIASLSEIHSMDINLYDLNGQLLATSNQPYVKYGLTANRINSMAYFNLHNLNASKYTQDEKVGNLNYTSAYVQVRDQKNKVQAYLSLPYLGKAKNLRSDISKFIVAIINVYVLLLVCAGLLAVFISNSITRSLTVIGGKMKETKLGKKNEMIDWPYNDEIGELVNEYNKMLLELENSAELITKSERESAWREMAKQVAHEIKNPLTPMKLSIQLLQRAIAEDRDDVQERTVKVADGLIEQIDSLSRIASEFSTFAKMPSTENEVFNLVEIIKSVVNLYNNNDKAAVMHKLPDLPCWVYADKEKMGRVFNNLINNSIQAIEDGQDGKVSVALKKDENNYLIVVEDNGIGIPVELRGKIFVPNFTTKGTGSGLGLAISKNIVSQAQGDIWFESEEGIGTKFYVKIPMHKV